LRLFCIDKVILSVMISFVFAPRHETSSGGVIGELRRFNSHLDLHLNNLRGGIVMFNATFNNISAISWRSVL
jgi:hypothetical protein